MNAIDSVTARTVFKTYFLDLLPAQCSVHQHSAFQVWIHVYYREKERVNQQGKFSWTKGENKQKWKGQLASKMTGQPVL